MVIYNIFCVLLSFVAAFLLIYGAIASGKIYAMEENEFVRQGLMVYTISKNVELLDTIFMILRQRWRQVSFLHVSDNILFFLDIFLELSDNFQLIFFSHVFVSITDFVF